MNPIQPWTQQICHSCWHSFISKNIRRRVSLLSTSICTSVSKWKMTFRLWLRKDVQCTGKLSAYDCGECLQQKKKSNRSIKFWKVFPAVNRTKRRHQHPSDSETSETVLCSKESYNAWRLFHFLCPTTGLTKCREPEQTFTLVLFFCERQMTLATKGTTGTISEVCVILQFFRVCMKHTAAPFTESIIFPQETQHAQTTAANLGLMGLVFKFFPNRPQSWAQIQGPWCHISRWHFIGRVRRCLFLESSEWNGWSNTSNQSLHQFFSQWKFFLHWLVHWSSTHSVLPPENICVNVGVACFVVSETRLKRSTRVSNVSCRICKSVVEPTLTKVWILISPRWCSWMTTRAPYGLCTAPALILKSLSESKSKSCERNFKHSSFDSFSSLSFSLEVSEAIPWCVFLRDECFLLNWTFKTKIVSQLDETFLWSLDSNCENLNWLWKLSIVDTTLWFPPSWFCTSIPLGRAVNKTNSKHFPLKWRCMRDKSAHACENTKIPRIVRSLVLPQISSVSRRWRQSAPSLIWGLRLAGG